MIEQLQHSLEKLTERQHDVILQVHETTHENMRFWRRILIDLTFFATTGMIGLAGFAVTRDRLPFESQIAMAVLIALLGWSAALVSMLVRRHMNEHAAIIVKLDHMMKLFETDAYFDQATVYPSGWLTYGSAKWSEPTLALCLWLLLAMPVPLTVIIIVTAR